MGCFLGCFGLSSNKKRRKFPKKILSANQRICSYEPLHSSDPTSLNVPEKPKKMPNSNLRCEAEEKKEAKTRKRVRFNLNVQTYEPLPRTYEDEDELKRAETSEDLTIKTSYPSNYRYQKCIEDEDETGYGESDLEDEDYYTDEDEIDYEDDADDEDEELYSEKEATSTGTEEMILLSSTRSHHYVTQVLNPVQNLAQWKEIKAKPVKFKQPMKENIEATKDDLLKEISVDVSLSNWIASPKNDSSKRYLLERSPILDITNLENR